MFIKMWILPALQKLYCVSYPSYIRKILYSVKLKIEFSGFKYINSGRVENMASSKILLYHSVQSILDVFDKEENKNVDGVKELLSIYENAFDLHKKNEASGETKKYPLIVLEGLDGSGKTTMGKRLAKKLNAKQWRTPPESIGHLRHLFDDDVCLRTAFYSLGNYIAALEVQLILKNEPVVMDRYWHSTAAYAIAQAVQDKPAKYEMPPQGDAIYCWPDDLFKPDMVLLLEVSEEVRLERHSRRKAFTTQEELLKASSGFRQNVLKAYKNMYNPGIKSINGNYSFGSTLGQLQKTVSPLFHQENL